MGVCPSQTQTMSPLVYGRSVYLLLIVFVCGLVTSGLGGTVVFFFACWTEQTVLSSAERPVMLLACVCEPFFSDSWWRSRLHHRAGHMHRL